MSIILTVVLVLSWVFFIYYFISCKEFIIQSDEKEVVFCHSLECEHNKDAYCQCEETKRISSERLCLNYNMDRAEFKITPGKQEIT